MYFPHSLFPYPQGILSDRNSRERTFLAGTGAVRIALKIIKVLEILKSCFQTEPGRHYAVGRDLSYLLSGLKIFHFFFFFLSHPFK